MAKAKRTSLKKLGQATRGRLHLREIKGEDDFLNETVGADLRAARLRLGQDLGSVADAIRIKVEHLRAIEESDIDALPGVTYALGFVRSYADFVGLGADECIRRFKAEITQRGEVKFSVMTHSEEKGFPFASLGIVMVGAVLAGLGWYVANLALKGDRDVIEEFDPALPQAEADVLPAQSAAKVTGDESDSSLLVLSGADSFAPSTATHEEIPDGVAWGGENHDGRIRLRARYRVWIRVESETRVLFERTLERGDSYTAPNRAEVLLATRDAGALDLFVDEAYLGRVGLVGAMSAGLILRADDLAVEPVGPEEP
jgi:cytoskeleton protein RodZ